MYPMDYKGITRELNIVHYADMKNMLKQPPFTYGTPVNVLLVSDRLPDFAKQVQECLQHSTDVTAHLVNDSKSALRLIYEIPFDFLIIVGTMLDESDYNFVRDFHYFNEYSISIVYGLMEEFVIFGLDEFGVLGVSNILLCRMGDLLNSMRQYYDNETERMHKDVSPDASREYLRLKVLAKYAAFNRNQKRNLRKGK